MTSFWFSPKNLSSLHLLVHTCASISRGFPRASFLTLIMTQFRLIRSGSPVEHGWSFRMNSMILRASLLNHVWTCAMLAGCQITSPVYPREMGLVDLAFQIEEIHSYRSTVCLANNEIPVDTTLIWVRCGLLFAFVGITNRCLTVQHYRRENPCSYRNQSDHTMITSITACSPPEHGCNQWMTLWWPNTLFAPDITEQRGECFRWSVCVQFELNWWEFVGTVQFSLLI